MRNRYLGAVLACAAIALPTAAAADWTFGSNVQGGVATAFLTRSTTYGGGIAFICDNASPAMPEYVLLVTSSPFDAALGRLDVTMTIGAEAPTVSPWTAQPRDNRLRSRDDIVLRDLLAALAAAPGITFTMHDDFGRDYRIEAPVENLADVVPSFLAACDALPAAAPMRF
ncbi:MAG: hypothetical protein IT534_10595 [Bauldia sp.]|nr:hypothetical protein [Bauldia sp.]